MSVIYLLITYFSGYAVTRRARLFEKDTVLLRNVFSVGIGTLLLGWMSYLFSYAVSIVLPAEDPMLYGNLIACLIGLLIIVFSLEYEKSRITVGIHAFWYKIKKVGLKEMIWKLKKYQTEGIFFFLLLIFLSYIFSYVFYIDQNNLLHAGATVFSDYAPHTAMMRSFSSGGNFPTEYPHFGGEDIRYHFMYQFFCGNLEYLGMPIDMAYNLPSIFFLWGFMVFLYYLGERLTGKKVAGILAVIFFLFRSSFSFFLFMFEHLQDGDLISALAENSSFIGYTANEDWGLWNFNVYLNQRHLGFGLLIGAILLWIFMEYIQDQKISKRIFFSKEAWKCWDIKKALCLGIILGSLAFWNGAVVIATLLMLLGFAIFSKGKLDYLIVAAITVLLSKLQVLFFMDGPEPGISFYFGFLAKNRTLAGVAGYLLVLTGIFFVGVILMLWLFKGKNRYLTFSFLLPTIFAFTVSMTGDITVNHKYIMISMALEGVLWAYAIIKLWNKKTFCALAGSLVFLLTVTGVFDMITIFKANGYGKEITVDMDSELTKWLQENVKPDELILTPPYAMNEVTLSGRKLYCGWPYYAWSAGYDTDHRSEVAESIYKSSDTNKINGLILSENISWVLIDENSQYNGSWYYNKILEELYPLVYEDKGIRIYAAKN